MQDEHALLHVQQAMVVPLKEVELGQHIDCQADGDTKHAGQPSVKRGTLFPAPEIRGSLLHQWDLKSTAEAQ